MKFASAKRLILQEEACKWGGRSKKYAAKVPFGAAGWVFQEIRIPKTNVSATPGPVSMTLGQ
ncbi:MAG TPA: hypothetical protein DEF88_01220, partial [Porphyromonadaceae bacterium]|nr:hypothetical protein [Porphyromonadaceae bacterium]